MIEKDRIKWIKPLLDKEKYKDIRFFSKADGDFGDFEGVQFDSEAKGGHIYFWSSGYVSYQIYDYIKDDEVVKDTLIKIKDSEVLENALADFLSNL